MKFKSIYILVVFCLFSIHTFADPITFTGRVIDAITKEPLPGATVTLPDLRTSVITNAKGEFSFNNLPTRGSFLIEIKYLGYKTLTQMVDLSVLSSIEFELQPSVLEAKEVLITGSAFSSDSKKNSTSVSAVSKEDLTTRLSANIIDAIAHIPGVSQITTGNAISKPVIRGLSYNRVLTLSNGVKQEGQQWGDEHGIEVDQFSAERIEVLRGAASLLYGSDALGGVINIIDPLPAPEGTLRGEIIINYSTNNGLSANSVMLQGNTNGFVYSARGSYKNAYSFKTPAGYLPNSGYNETNFSGEIGLNKGWGYTHLDLSSFKNTIGFYEPVVNSHGQFVDDNAEVFSDTQLKNRKVSFPKQDVRHYKAALNSNLILGRNRLKSTLGFQHNIRRELGEPNSTPELSLDLNTYSFDLKYYFHENNGWEPVIGASGQMQNSNNTQGVETLIPSYDSRNIGAFVYVKKTLGNSTLNTGVRFDYRNLNGKEFDEDGSIKFEAFTNTFSNFSGALGFTHEFNDHLSFKANAGSAFRAPNIAELASNGVHEGAFRYEIGNKDLKQEQSYQLDSQLAYEQDIVSLSLGGFVNYIDNYIYYSNKNNELINIDGENFPVYRFIQDKALLQGLEASLTLHPLGFIHFENSFSYTNASNKTLNKPLPFIPAATLRNEIRFEPKIKGTSKSYISLGLDNFLAQNRIDDFETPTAAYTLFNAGIGTTLKLNRQPVTLYIAGKNLLNKKYCDHLSRYKPGRLDDTDPTLGVFNPGRNITFGVYIPIVLKK
ncbi:MAG: TonB-dependent receptor [Daejeonella sp.]